MPYSSVDLLLLRDSTYAPCCLNSLAVAGEMETLFCLDRGCCVVLEDDFLAPASSFSQIKYETTRTNCIIR